MTRLVLVALIAFSAPALAHATLPKAGCCAPRPTCIAAPSKPCLKDRLGGAFRCLKPRLPIASLSSIPRCKPLCPLPTCKPLCRTTECNLFKPIAWPTLGCKDKAPSCRPSKCGDRTCHTCCPPKPVACAPGCRACVPSGCGALRGAPYEHPHIHHPHNDHQHVIPSNPYPVQPNVPTHPMPPYNQQPIPQDQPVPGGQPFIPTEQPANAQPPVPGAPQIPQAGLRLPFQTTNYQPGSLDRMESTLLRLESKVDRIVERLEERDRTMQVQYRSASQTQQRSGYRPMTQIQTLSPAQQQEIQRQVQQQLQQQHEQQRLRMQQVIAR